MPNTPIDITLYRDGIEGIIMPFEVDNEPLSQGNVGPLKYITKMERALHLLKPDLNFDAAYPTWVTVQEDENLIENGIVWSINKMLPVNLGGKPQSNPDAGTREVKPRIRTDLFLEDGGAIRVSAQRFTVFFQFDIFAKSPNEAEELVDWFQFAFMDHFGGLFGSHYTVFRQRFKDKEVEKLNQNFNVRSLEYIVDIEKVTATLESTIDVINIKVNNQ